MPLISSHVLEVKNDNGLSHVTKATDWLKDCHFQVTAIWMQMTYIYLQFFSNQSIIKTDTCVLWLKFHFILSFGENCHFISQMFDKIVALFCDLLMENSHLISQLLHENHSFNSQWFDKICHFISLSFVENHCYISLIVQRKTFFFSIDENRHFISL